MSVPFRLLLRSVALKQANTSYRGLATTAVAVKEDAVPAPVKKKAAPVKSGWVQDLAVSYVPENAGNHRYVPADFKEFPERDVKNFPHPNRKEFPSKTRLYVIPDSWFKFFYDKTGETGGYLFFGGVGLFMLQKEWLVLAEPLAMMLGPQLCAVVLYHLFFGRALGKFWHGMADERFNKVAEWADKQQAHLKAGIAAETDIQGKLSVLRDLVPAVKKENVALQLEGQYRERVNQIYVQVKRQLDFLSEYETTKRRLEMRHMADWINKEVRKSVTPQLEAAALKQCIVDLQTLSNKQ